MFRNSVPVLAVRLSSLFIILSIFLSRDLFMGQSLFLPFRSIQGFSLVGPSLFVVVVVLILLLVFVAIKPSGYLLKITALACYCLLCIDDLNRFQVEFLIYFLILFIPVDSKKEGSLSLLIFLSLIYFGAGVSKFNPEFTDFINPWFWKPLIDIQPGGLLSSVVGNVIPSLFVVLSVSLLVSRKLRFLAVSVLILIHAALIFMLLLVHNSYYGLCLLNLFCIVILFSLFYLRVEEDKEIDYNLLAPVYVVVVLFVSSALSLIHPYFSFQVFSSAPVKAVVMVSEPYFNRLPDYLKEGNGDYNGERYIDFPLMYAKNSSFAAYPNVDNYLRNMALFSTLAQSNDDLVLIIKRHSIGGLGDGLYGYTLEEINRGEFNIE